ncbi:PaaI family thioesterase [Evansella cellulosilytica]|uniref:Thioesterase superfamily protein n=1 Tax=Evansella cellulosilytica (strain ATCC 21833 / DSM 2522 / FERM P-1141 / JCM 9156 / N-4) TaxID=649639 RepID=E6TUG3_EVAC2|nr:PaaI family thioesterase [Evansella cellulosilytica]ADU29719.1 thioesterase superfamily protein [Evansella cellulosilytica DSM 2522]
MEENKLRELFEHALHTHQDHSGNLFMYSLLDFNIEYLEEEEQVVIQVPITPIMFNPIGFIHGGIISYIADTAMGHLCAAFCETPSVTLELKTQFLSTAREGTVTATAYFTKKGRKVQFVECELKNEEGKLLAKVSGTFYPIS